MFRKSLVFVIALSVILDRTCAEEKLARIHGGAIAGDTAFPWTASLRFDNFHSCGGTIINRRTVLTAAHCVKLFPPQRLSVRVGSIARTWGGQVLGVENVTHHERFDEESFDYDIAVLRLDNDIVMSDKAQAIGLASAEADVRDGDIGYISGWGVLEDGKLPLFLQFLEVMVYNRSVCAELLDASITERMLCAGVPEAGMNSCDGDSGGPLVVNGKLAGISSWGLDCGDPLKPDVYSRVSVLAPWVSEYLSQFGECLE